MSVNQGLKTLAENQPEFDNKGIDNLIAIVNVGWVAKSRLLAQKIDTSTVLTGSQKNDLANDLATHEYLNLGRVLEDLSLHTQKIFTGVLGQQDLNDDRPNTGTFLDHVQSVQGFISTIPFLYGYTADSINKGIPGHFGTVDGTLGTAMETLRKAVVQITDKTLSTDTAFQTAITNLNNFLTTLDGSTDANNTSFNSLRAAYVTAANNFNTVLAGNAYTSYRTDLINGRKIVVDQIALEIANLGTIRTYEDALANISVYVNLATDDAVRSLIIRTSNNKSFKEYFENFAKRQSLLNPLYSDIIDSSLDSKIEEVLKLKGLPDVVDFQDIDSVANKATKDIRLATVLKTQGKTSEEIIEDACDVLKIDKRNKTTFALSNSLLENMNNNDRELVKIEITTQQSIDSLS